MCVSVSRTERDNKDRAKIRRFKTNVWKGASMYLIPQLQRLHIVKDQTYTVSYDQKIVIHPSTGSGGMTPARLLQQELQDMLGYAPAITQGRSCKTAVLLALDSEHSDPDSLQIHPQSYSLKIAADGIRITAAERSGLLYGVQTLRQIFRQCGGIVPCLDIYDYPSILYRGYYLDVTRGRIPTPAYLKQLADRLAFYKINQLQLYMEHSFLFEGLSEVWRDDTPLTAQDILELDAYCADLGIELVPSISSFGHLYKILRTRSWRHLCELDTADEPFGFISRMEHHTIDASNGESLAFIKGLIQEYLPLFTSSRFNIGCDETFDLGTGKSRKRAMEIGKDRLYIEFVKELCTFLTSQGKIPMLWSDILVHFPEAVRELPAQTVCLTWGYGAAQDDVMIKKLAQAGAVQYACPGVSGWNQFTNQLKYAYENIRRMCSYAGSYHTEGVLTTDWGDFGHINHPDFGIPAMIYGAAFSWNAHILPFDEINRQISKIEYGDSTETFVQTAALLPEGWDQLWGNLIRYKERAQTALFEVRPDETESALSRLQDIKNRLYALQPELPKEKRPLIHAYFTAIDGIRIFGLIQVYLTKRRCTEREDTGIQGRYLAAELEEWFYYYKELWRSASRESELHRIQETVCWYADLLRA